MASLRIFIMLALIFMLAFAPFVLSFRPFHQEVKEVFPDVEIQQARKEGNAETMGINTLENQQERKEDNAGKLMGMEEDYARQIPTGPDPLHHNHHPSKP